MEKTDKKVLIYTLVFLIIIFFVLTLIGAFSVEVIKVFEFPWHISKTPFLDVWAKWDSGYFMDIATKGYSYSPDNPKFQNVVFFPLYSIILKIINSVVKSILVTGILVSNFFLFLSLIILFKLVKLEIKNENIAKNSLIYLLIFPTSFFFLAVYSESLFLFNILATFYFLKKDNLKLVSIFGVLTSLTKSIGFMIIVPLIYFAIKNKFELRKIFYILVIPVGTLIFLSYLYINFGLTPLELISIEEKAWERNPWYNLENINKFFSNIYDILFLKEFSIKSLKLIYIINLNFVIIATLLIIYSTKILKDKIYLIYSLTFLFSPIILGHIVAMTRFVIILFPVYIALASIKNSIINNIIKFVSISFLIILFMMFVNWFAIY